MQAEARRSCGTGVGQKRRTRLNWNRNEGRAGHHLEERLQKILARSGVASRRKAEEMIREGRVASIRKSSGAGLKGRHRAGRDPCGRQADLRGRNEGLCNAEQAPRYVTALSDRRNGPW